jgi:uncharacterized protein involved in outer membrane biogenesis
MMTSKQRGWSIFGGVFATLALAVVIFVAVFDWNWFKPYFERQASAGVGRPVQIGSLNVQDVFSRTPLLILDRVTVDNPPGFTPASGLEPIKGAAANPDSPVVLPSGRMAEIERIAIRIEIVKLWREHKLLLPDVVIDKPLFRLERAAGQKPNWFIEPVGGTQSSEGYAPQIRKLAINDGHARLIDDEMKSDVDLAVHTEPGSQGGAPEVVVKGEGRYANAATKLDLRGGSVLTVAQADIRYPVDLVWVVGPTQVKLTGTVDNPLSFSGLDGIVELKGPDLALLFPILGIPLPPSAPYLLAGHVAYSGTTVRVQNMDGTLGSSDLVGNFTVETGGERLRLDGDFSSRKIVLADLAGFVGATPGKVEATSAKPAPRAKKLAENAGAKALPDKDIDLTALNAIDAHVTYRGIRVESDNMPFDNLSAKLDLEKGVLRMTPLDFGVGKGTISTNLELDGRVAPPKISLDATFRNLDLKRIMQETKAFDGAGTIGGRARIVSTGMSTADILARGDGAITAVMSGGEISAVLTELSGLDLTEAIGTAILEKGKQYPIRCAVLDGGLRKGVLTTNTLVIDTTDTNILGAGTIDLRNETMNLRLEPHPKDVSILTFRTPINVRGPMTNPSISLDPSQAGARAGVMIALGVLLTPLAALIPTIELGLGEDSDCRGLVAQARGAQKKPIERGKAGPPPLPGAIPQVGSAARPAPDAKPVEALPPPRGGVDAPARGRD